MLNWSALAAECMVCFWPQVNKLMILAVVFAEENLETRQSEPFESLKYRSSPLLHVSRALDSTSNPELYEDLSLS